MKAKSAVAPKSASRRVARANGAASPMAHRFRRGDTTRQSILDAAERSFAEGGFDGVSLRITERAGVDLALANYHFGTKDNLLHEVIARRARIVHDERVRALEMARLDAGAQSPSVEAIVTAFFDPLLRRLPDGEPGWHHYGHLVSHLDVLPKFTAITGRTSSITRRCISSMRCGLLCPRPRSVRSIGATCS